MVDKSHLRLKAKAEKVKRVAESKENKREKCKKPTKLQFF